MANPLKRHQRRELIRQLILSGASDSELTEQVVAGFTIEGGGPHQGKTCKATAKTVRGDLASIADDYREAVTDIGAHARLTGSTIERLNQAAGAALLAGNYAAAVRSSVELLKEARKSRRFKTADDALQRRIDHALGRRHVPQPKKTGRPSKLNKKIIARISDDMRLGASQKSAGLRAGISTAALASWLARGRIDREVGRRTLFAYLVEEVEKASADLEVSCLATINQAIEDGEWQAGFRMLESKHPDQYLRRPSVQVNQATVINTEGPTIVTAVPIDQLAQLDVDQLRALAYEEEPLMIEAVAEEAPDE